MQNVLLLTLLALISACSPKEEAHVPNLELEKKYLNSSYLIVRSVKEKLAEPVISAHNDYVVGKEKTTYVNKVLLTLSNEKEQRIYLPYVKPINNVKFGYEIPKTRKELEQKNSTNKVEFVELDKSLSYPLQILRQLPNEYYIPQEELSIDKNVIKSETKGSHIIAENATHAPAFFVLVGDVFIGLNEDLTLAHSYYLRKDLEYIRLKLVDDKIDLKFTQISKTKKTALSEKNYSIIYLGKKGNTLHFKKIYNNSNKPSEVREIVMNSPQIDVFGHKILVQTATREALHYIIKN